MCCWYRPGMIFFFCFKLAMKILKNALLISFLICFRYCCSTKFNVSILPHQYLKDGDVLASGSGLFELGFFSPGNSDRRYLGIWFRGDAENTVVWVANRDSPIRDSSGFLSIRDHGNLVILSGKQSSRVWSSNVSTVASPNVSMATLLDTGNLVMLHSNRRTILWQSFDFPTDTLLPTMKLGLDRKTSVNRYLTSWKSPDDPGTGDYAYRIDPSGFPQLYLFKDGDPVWRTGPWNGMRWSGVPEMSNKLNLYKDTEFVNNDDGMYMTISTIDPSVWSRLVMNVSGLVQLSSWSNADPKWNVLFFAPADQCDGHYGLCGAYSSCNPYNPNVFVCRCLPGYEPKSPHNWSVRDGAEGCVRKRLTSPACGKGEGFVKMRLVKLPDTSKAFYNMSMSLKNCKRKCLSNCSCKAYTSADIRNGGSGCVAWYDDLRDVREYIYLNGGQDLYVRVDADELADYNKRKTLHDKKIIAAVATCVALFLIFVILIVFCIIKRRREGKNREDPCSARYQDSPMSKELQGQASSDLPFYGLDTIVNATSNFSPANKLGEGGFGPVYKGVLPNGQEIAVKRLSKSSGQGMEEFKNEVMLIAKLQHRNLVKLFGCCTQNDEKMLVYEYLPNNSLDSIIFDETNKSLLDWRKRFEIICGIARGILYLHEDSRLRIIHRDLKASNVLLDATLNSKISDFGMARIFGVDQVSANTNRVVGTYGYMSPEYAMEGLFSVKSDVYSFGVLLLEIVAGRKNSSFLQSSSNLTGHIWNLWKEGKELDIVDEALLGESYSVEEVLRCIRIGLLCVQESASDRPTMFTVLFMLGNEAPVASPKQPAFILRKTFSSADPSTASDGSTSITANVMTVTMHEGR